MATNFLDTLQNLIKTVSANAATYGIDTSDNRIKADGYKVALSAITETPWESAYSPEKGQYIVYPRDLAAARKWAELQAGKKSAVGLQWWPVVQPIAVKAALPYAIGIFAAGFIVARVVK